MARVIIHRGTHPLEATAFAMAPRVARVLREEYRHDVRVLTTRNPARKGAKTVREAYYDGRVAQAFKKALKTPKAFFFDFHNTPTPPGLLDSPEKVLGKIKQTELENTHPVEGVSNLFGFTYAQKPVWFPKTREVDGIETPKNFYAVEVSSKSKRLPKKGRYADESGIQGLEVSNATLSRQAGLTSEELIRHVAWGIHKIITKNGGKP